MKTIIINKKIIDKMTELFSPYSRRYQDFLKKHEKDIIIECEQDDLKYLLFRLLDLREDLDIHISNDLESYN